AIKHTPPDGQVQMTLVLQNGQYTITVTDTGGGIPVDAQSHIFERFYCVDKARSRTATSHGSGAGLGLAIARWIAQAHNSFFPFITYEGARSITGPYLAVLGASATAVGLAAGFGELVGYGLRLVAGYLSDRTGRYWMFTLVGYVVNVLAVPFLA